MASPEHKSGLETVENGQARHAQDECRAAVVAKCQKTLGFLPGAQFLFIKGTGGFGSHRVSTQQSQGKHRGADAGKTKENFHRFFQQPPAFGGSTGAHHQPGKYEKGKQGRNEHLGTKRKPLAQAFRGLPAIAQKAIGKEAQSHIGENGKKGGKKIFFHIGFTSLRYMKGTGKNSTLGA